MRAPPPPGLFWSVYFSSFSYFSCCLEATSSFARCAVGTRKSPGQQHLGLVGFIVVFFSCPIRCFDERKRNRNRKLNNQVLLSLGQLEMTRKNPILTRCYFLPARPINTSEKRTSPLFKFLFSIVPEKRSSCTTALLSTPRKFTGGLPGGPGRGCC